MNNFIYYLGLAILLNTCCPLTQKQYNRFCAHVTAVATNDQDLVPVTNRYDAAKINSYLHGYVISAFKHLSRSQYFNFKHQT